MGKHLVDKLSHHAVPLAAASDWCAVLAVVDQFDDVVEFQLLGDLLQQVDAEALEAPVPRVDAIRLGRV